MAQKRMKSIIRLSTNRLQCSIFILYIFLLCFFHAYCSALDVLKHGEWIFDNGSRSTLVSPGGMFELGFFTPPEAASPKRFVGIWYHRDQRVVVWVANRNDPVLGNFTGVFGIKKDGNLMVSDTNGTEYWSTTTSLGRYAFGSVIVKLMDSGNLVLSKDDDQSAMNYWESFKNPTDTFLLGMKMDENIELVSWNDSGDPGSGQFTFKEDKEGKDSYVITTKLFLESRLSSDEMRYDIACLLSNFSTINCPSYFSNQSRLVMDYMGRLKYLKWDMEKKYWSLEWWEPKDQCKIDNVCGKFGSCNINNKIVCKCLPGFKPSNPEKWESQEFRDGCTRNLTLYDKSDTFLSLTMMKVSETNLQFSVQNEKECRNSCLEDPRCQAYSYEAAENSTKRGDTTTSTDLCRIWTDDLINLEEEYPNGRNLSVRIAKSDIESTARNCEPCGTNLIPYPLSTRPNCGDPMYNTFYCNTSTGQVSFMTSSGAYRVTNINSSTKKFVIQLKYADNRVAKSLPFSVTDPFTAEGNFSSEITPEVVEITWKPPKEPTCNSSTGCKDWPHSTCNVARDGQRRCLCTTNWDGLSLNCTTGNIPRSVGGGIPGSLEKHSRRKMPLSFIVVVSLFSVTVLSCAIIFLYIWRRKMAKRQENRNSNKRDRALRKLDTERHVKDLIDSGEFREGGESEIDLPFFDLESILAATDNFSDANKLGQGGYGPVYKGTFPGDQEIAIKRLSSVSRQGLQEFKNEVVLIAKLQHRNLVRLRGYCTKGDEKILLYEYMPNKSLDSFIFDQKLSVLLDWEMRFNIILGIARGLLYLHQDSRLRIIHRDLKTSNILLDQEMNPKISDFGLARFVGGNEIEANTTRVAGTYGYMSPEYVLNGVFSIKSDVFSFGVILLEIISGKKNTGFYRSEQAMSLIDYAWRLWTENKVLDLMDQTIHETLNAAKFMKCVNVGLLCIEEDPNDRPTMSNVVTMLDSETGTVPTPKQPAFVMKRGQSSTASSSSRPETCTEFTTSVEEAQ